MTWPWPRSEKRNMKSTKKNHRTGSAFEDFLKEDGIYEECTATAVKRVLAWQIEQEMNRQKITKSAMAHRMHTSRSQLDRLLNPNRTGVHSKPSSAATVIGRELRIQLV